MSDAHAHDHGDHHPLLDHHWESLDQQFEAGKLGMWLFLATEILLFGGLFCAYAIWRFHHPEMFKFGSTFLDTKWGAINTAVLILSSLTMAAAVTLSQMGKMREMLICLVLTLAGAFGFLGIKYVEYSHKFHEGYFPGIKFYAQPPTVSHTWDPEAQVAGIDLSPVDPTQTALTIDELGLPEDVPVELSTVGPAAEAPGGLSPDVLAMWEDARGGAGSADEEHAPDDARHEAGQEAGHEDSHDQLHPLQDSRRPEDVHMFFNIYFMMTGLHGIHVIIGGLVISWLIMKALVAERYVGRTGIIARCVGKPIRADYFTPVDLGGLYWHVVDLIWIFLFPLFYLI